MFKTDLLAGKKILVTGGGTGLGKSIGRRYLELGAHLVICGRRKEVLDATAEEFRAAVSNAKVDTYACEWKEAVNNPETRARFRHFVNSPEADSNVVFMEERGQIRPATVEERKTIPIKAIA